MDMIVTNLIWWWGGGGLRGARHDEMMITKLLKPPNLFLRGQKWSKVSKKIFNDVMRSIKFISGMC